MSDSAPSSYCGRPLSVLRVIVCASSVQPKPNGPFPAADAYDMVRDGVRRAWLSGSGSDSSAVPVAALTDIFSSKLRIAPPPLGSDTLGNTSDSFRRSSPISGPPAAPPPLRPARAATSSAAGERGAERRALRSSDSAIASDLTGHRTKFYHARRHRQVKRRWAQARRFYSAVRSGRSACLGDLAPNREGVLARSSAAIGSDGFGIGNVEEIRHLIVNR